LAEATFEQAKTPSKKYSYYVFSLLFLLYMFDYIDRMVIASLFPFLKADWGLSDAQCGMLISAVYWSIIVFTLPISVLIDRWSRKKSIGIMALLWSVATAACAFTRGFGQIFVARVGVGLGEAGYAPGGTAMISALFPQEKRAKIMGLWNASIPLGSAIGVVLGGFVAKYWGWRHAFGIVAIPGAIVALLFFWVKDYKTVELAKYADEQVEAKKKVRWAEVAREILRSKSLVLTYLGFAGNAFVTTSLLTWLPSYFSRVDGTSIEKASMKSGSVMLLAIIGAPLGGYLADTWLKRRANARLVFAGLTSCFTALLLFLAFRVPAGTAQYLFLLATGVSIVAFLPAAAAVTQDVVHPGIRALSYSLCVVVQNLLGASLGPVFVGAISDRYDLRTALMVLPIFTLIAGILFLIASQFYVRDLARVEKVPLNFEC
jgi:MFS family permease